MTLTEFIKQYFNVPNTGDTPQNLGQCVGLVEKWIDSLSLPHVWGNAADLLANADPNSYDIIQNTPDGVPTPGDIFCFGASYGGGVGHTGIVVAADTNIVSLFEQNDGINGGTPQFKTYTYDGALGWLHPKGVVVDEQSLLDALRNQRDANWNLYQAELSKNTDLQKQLSDIQAQLASQVVSQPVTEQTTQTSTEVPLTASTNGGSTVVNVAVTTPQVPTSQNETITLPIQAKSEPKMSLLQWVLKLLSYIIQVKRG